MRRRKLHAKAGTLNPEPQKRCFPQRRRDAEKRKNELSCPSLIALRSLESEANGREETKRKRIISHRERRDRRENDKINQIYKNAYIYGEKGVFLKNVSYLLFCISLVALRL